MCGAIRQSNVLVGDGKAGVTHMVKASPHGLPVYGVVDRDFDDDNAVNWTSPGCRVLRLPAHEIENLLLDFDVLASLSGSDPEPPASGSSHTTTRRRCGSE